MHLQKTKLYQASLTIECAFILPLFLFAIVTLIVFMDTIGIQAEKNIDLSNKARKIAMFESVLSGSGPNTWVDIPGIYRYKFPYTIIPVPSFNIASRARVYPWVGFDRNSGLFNSYSDKGGSNDVVFVSDNQEVYHTDPNCTHIDISIISVPYSQVKNMRSSDGSKYRPCPGFPSGYSGSVYVTPNGSYYYPSTDYGGLTRNIRMVKKEDVSALPLCSRCASKH